MQTRTLGRTARLVGAFAKDRPGITVATKAGCRADPRRPRPVSASSRGSRSHAAAASLPPLDPAFVTRLADVYDRHVRAHVHERW